MGIHKTDVKLNEYSKKIEDNLTFNEFLGS